MNTTDTAAPTDAAITACALMIKGICLTKHSDDWTKLIEARIRFMLASQDQLPDTEAGQCAHCGHNAFATTPQTDGAPTRKHSAHIKWPEGYCLDPNGVMCCPDGKHEDWSFGYDLGYADALALRAEIAATHAPAMAETKTDAALADDEAEEFARTVEDFEDDGETSTDYETLMEWAQRGLLECTHFEVTKAGTAEIERIDRAAAFGGEQS